MWLMVRVGGACAAHLDRTMRHLPCEVLEVDEVWCYVAKKQLRLTVEERSNRAIGDQYTFIALDPKSKLVASFMVGKRDVHTARDFVADLRSRLNGDPIQITSNGFACYPDAIERAWGADPVSYAQPIKVYNAEYSGRGRYSPSKVTDVVSTVIRGNPDEKRICTSYVVPTGMLRDSAQSRLVRSSPRGGPCMIHPDFSP